MNTVTIKPSAGTHIDMACEDAQKLAKSARCRVTFAFNGQRLFSTPKKSISSMLWDWNIGMERLEKKYHNSVAGKQQAEKMRKTIEFAQRTIDRLMVELESLSGLTETIQWLREFTEHSEWSAVSFPRDTIYWKLSLAGYEENAHVGRSNTDFDGNLTILGEYIVGQAMNCLRHGMGPHQMTMHFCDKYLEMKSDKELRDSTSEV